MTLHASTIGRRDRIKTAQEFISGGRLDEAEALLDELGGGAHDPDALNARSTLALARRQTGSAFELLSDAATAYPDHAGLATNLGITYELMGRHDEAVICLERAVALAPDNNDVKLSLAHALMSRGNMDDARKIAEDTAQRDPTNARAFVQLGAIDLATHDHAAAEAALLHGLEIAPDDAQTLRNLSALYVGRGRFDEALSFAERAYLRAPLDSSALLHLAYCRAAAGHWTEAEKACRKLLTYSPSHIGAREIIARIKIAQGDIDGGIADLTQLVRARKTDLTATLSLARALQMTGRFGDALKVAEHAVAMAPGDTAAASLKATLELTLGHFPPPEAAALQFMDAILVPPATGALEFATLSRLLKRLAVRQVVRVIAEPRYQSLLSQLAEPVIPESPQPLAAVTPLQSLLRMMAVTGDNAADDIPYLKPDSDLFFKWQNAFAEFPRPLVGFVWDGGPLGLSMEHVASILPEGATPVSLVTDESRHDLRRWNRPVDAGVHIDSPAEMIAAVANLDVVVGPDHFALHLAGALGVGGVALVPCGYPWYWAMRDGRALWYPSIEVMVQKRLGDWDEALAEARCLVASAVSQAT